MLRLVTMMNYIPPMASDLILTTSPPMNNTSLKSLSRVCFPGLPLIHVALDKDSSEQILNQS